MIQTIIGKKLGQVQGFLQDGQRIPMTRINVAGNVVSQIKSVEKDGYEAVQIGFGSNKKASKPLTNHAKKAGLTSTPRFFRETKVEKMDAIELGAPVVVEEILEAGDIVDVSGTSKGKGYAGVVKRHHFKGGPKTHGQSDRHRAPGSIGQSTTPGRVYKGKRMAGRMGNENVTVKNLEVIDYADGVLVVKGLIPGPISSIVTITRRGKNKKHVGLYQEPVVEEVVIDEAQVEEIGPAIEEQEEMRKEAEVKADIEEKAEAEAQQTANQDKDEEFEASHSSKVPDPREVAAEEAKIAEETPVEEAAAVEASNIEETVEASEASGEEEAVTEEPASVEDSGEAKEAK